MQEELREQALSTLDRYEKIFRQQPPLTKLRQLLSRPEDCFARSNMRGHITTSAAVLSPDLKSLLLIHHIHFDCWLPPGGHYEPPGSLWESAAREVAEETGIAQLHLHQWSIRRDIPVSIVTAPVPERPSKNEGPHWHHDFRYLAIAETEELTPQLEEVHAARWVSLKELAFTERKNVRELARRIIAIR